MIKIKDVTLEAIAQAVSCGKVGYYWQYYTFRTISDGTTSFYFINGERTTKEEGNKKYSALKEQNSYWRTTKDSKNFCNRNKISPADTFKIETKEKEVTKEELIAIYEAGIDKYAEYIDDYSQYRETVKANKKHKALIEIFEETF